MARASYFQKVVARTFDSPHVQPASGLLTRWSQVTDAAPAMIRGTAPAAAPLVAGAPIASANPTRSRLPDPSQPEPRLRNNDRDPGAFSTAAEVPPEPVPARLRIVETPNPGASPPKLSTGLKAGAATRSEPPRLTSPPPPKSGSRATLQSQPSQAFRSTQEHKPITPELSPPKQRQPVAPAQALTKVVEKRIEREFVMPAKPGPATSIPPPASKGGASVQIGSIQVTVVRESAPAPTVAAPQPQTQAPFRSVPAPTPVTRISRAIAVAHGFHQS